jgi:predicted dienelactone hydrolase
MRTLEILLPLLLAVYILWPLIGLKRTTLLRFVPAIAFIVMLVHFSLEGARWQMIPIYAVTVIVFLYGTALFTQADIDQTARPNGWTIAGLSASILILVLATALPALLPVPQVPAPTGPYTVGTTIFELTDITRKELYSGRDEPRRIVVQMWYPADPLPGAQLAPWMPEAGKIAPAISTHLNLPRFFLDHLAYSKSDSYLDLPIKRDPTPYPIILFSHGWDGFRAQNTYQMQELASHGYVVAALDHSYGAIMTVFPDGTIAPNNPSALPEDAPEAEYEIAARKLVNQWSGDLGFVLTYLEEQNRDQFSPYFDTMNTDLVGALGHSTGGGAAIQFCATDPRCKAVFLMDAFMRPVSEDVLANGVKQPALFMFSQEWAGDLDSRNNQLFNRFYPNVALPAPAITIEGTMHYDFTDLPALSPLAPQLGLKGPINGARVQRLIDDFTLAFFNKYLLGIPTTLLDGPSANYPELRWR